MKLFKTIKSIFLLTVKGFNEHSLMTFAASIAFYTIFALPGLLISLVLIAGLFLGNDAAEGEIVSQLGHYMGSGSAQSVQNVISTIEISGNITWKMIFGVGILIFSATTIFISLQEALNRIWDVVATPKKGILKFIINRILSFGMIISLGFILLISLLLDTLLTVFFNKLENTLGHESSLLFVISGIFISALLVFSVILLIFKTLPDVKLRWKDAAKASAITTFFLILGNYLIGIYIENSSFSQTYEAAGSIIVILIWVYYSTIVVLMGAEIMRAIMIHNRRPIEPADGAMKVKMQQLKYKEYVSRTYDKK